MGGNFLEQFLFLTEVDSLDRVQQLGVVAVFQRGALQCAHILGEAGPAVPGARVDKLIANTWIGADAITYGFYIGAKYLGDIR